MTENRIECIETHTCIQCVCVTDFRTRGLDKKRRRRIRNNNDSKNYSIHKQNTTFTNRKKKKCYSTLHMNLSKFSISNFTYMFLLFYYFSLFLESSIPKIVFFSQHATKEKEEEELKRTNGRQAKSTQIFKCQCVFVCLVPCLCACEREREKKKGRACYM